MAIRLKSVLSIVSVPSDAPAKSRDFFEKLLGIDLVPALAAEECYHAPLSMDGIDLNVTGRHSPHEGVTAFFGTDDLAGALRNAKQWGARVVWGPDTLSIPPSDFEAYKEEALEFKEKVDSPTLANAAILVEPGGSQLGLFQVAEHAKKHFKVGQYYQPLTDEQVMVHQRSAIAAKKCNKIGAR
jgi:hypothetical protein